MRFSRLLLFSSFPHGPIRESRSENILNAALPLDVGSAASVSVASLASVVGTSGRERVRRQRGERNPHERVLPVVTGTFLSPPSTRSMDAERSWRVKRGGGVPVFRLKGPPSA
jgi:hypothetical protein